MPKDLVRAYGTMANGGRLAYQTTIVTVSDGSGEELLGVRHRAGARAGARPRDGRDHDRHPRGQHRTRGSTRSGASSGSPTGTGGARRRSRPAPTTTPATSTPTATSGPRTGAERADGEYALAVGAWNGNSDNSLVSTAAEPAVLDRRHDVRLAGVPQRGDRGLVHQRLPHTGLAAAGRAWTRGRASRPGATASPSCSSTGRCPRAACRPEPAARPSSRSRASRTSIRTGWRRTAAGSAAPSGARGCAADPRAPARAYFYNPAVQPVRQVLGAARGVRVRLAEPEPERVRRPLRIGRSQRIRGPQCLGRPQRVRDRLPVAVRVRIDRAHADGDADGGPDTHGGAHRGSPADARTPDAHAGAADAGAPTPEPPAPTPEPPAPTPAP